MLKVWGRLNSVNVQKAMFCVEELELPYERFNAGMEFGVTKTPEYMAMNPNSRVPTIDDDGFVLWESNVIVRYLAAKHSPGKLWPTDPQKRADIDRWMDWQQTTHNPPLTTLFWGLVRAPGTRPPEEIEAARKTMVDLMAMLEARLEGRAFIGGDAFTMADCVMGPAIHRWRNVPFEREHRPNVERYYRSIMERPAARKVLTLPLT
jgi:glutathione S-transferase